MLIGWAAAQPAAARASGPLAQVENRCPRLQPAEFDELNARVMLRLTAAHDTRSPPSVGCNDAEAWVEWNGERFQTPGRGSIVDEVVEIIESALEAEESKAAPPPPPPAPLGGEAEDGPPAADQPAADKSVRSVAPASGGGIAIALETELPSSTIGVSVGPTFDFGTSVGPFWVGARESFRFATSGPQVSFMDFEGLVGVGAPLRSDAPLGVVLRMGAACMVAYPKGSALADFAPTVSLGVRGARPCSTSRRSGSVWTRGSVCRRCAWAARSRSKPMSLAVRSA